MNLFKHVRRFLKSVNKRVIHPLYNVLKPVIRLIKNDPYEINLIANKQFQSSDFVVVHNVKSYEFHDFNSWKIQALSPKYEHGTSGLYNTPLPIYIAIDTKFHDAFGHWFFESAIWLTKIKKILDQFPSAQIHLKENRGYKTQIMNYFDISQDRITTELSVDFNCCVFFNPCTSLNDSRENVRFRELLLDFSKQFHQNVTQKKINYLLMPRQKKGNYASNDRQINTDDLELLLEEIPNSEIFNSDASPSFAYQISKVQSSKHLLVADGSAFMVNAFLAESSVVFVLGDALVPNQRQVQVKTHIICDLIEHNNAVTYLHSSDNVFTRQILRQWLSSL